MGKWTPGPAGTDGDDLFRGNFQDELAKGLAGDDTLIGGAGNDTLNGGEGNDLLYAGQEELGGNSGDGLDRLLGGSGDDHLINFNAKFASTLLGGEGADTIESSSACLVDGGGGDDIVHLRDGNRGATLKGGEGLDTLFIDKDVMIADLTSGSGFEVLVVAASAWPLQVRGDADANLIDFSGFTSVTGSLQFVAGRGDTIVGTLNNDTLEGADAVFTLHGGLGDDLLQALDARSELHGDGGDDGFGGSGIMFGGDGDDTFLGVAGDGNEQGRRNIIDGGGGIDTLEGLYHVGSSLFLDMGASAAGIVQNVGPSSFVFVERLNLSYNDGRMVGDDEIIGFIYADRILGMHGADTLFGMDGDDTLEGEDGADQLVGGAGEDDIFGGDGDDILRGGADEDRMLGELGHDQLRGDAGSDSLDGGVGQDELLGGDGADALNGGDEADTLIGGKGSDLLTGGKGKDTFIFGKGDLGSGSRDVVFRFGEGGVSEVIDLSGVDADKTTAGNQTFAYIGENAFSGVAGELQVLHVGANTYEVRGDLNGDGKADFRIDLQTVGQGVDLDSFVL